VWPTRMEAETLPDPCPVIERAVKPESGPNAGRPHRGDSDGTSTNCEWGNESHFLRLYYWRYTYQAGQDGGVEQAEERFHEFFGKSTPDMTALPGVGDEALIWTQTWSERVESIRIYVRRGNVVAWVTYLPPSGRDAKALAVPFAVRMARAAAAEITLK
jgi:hypothetical protein